MGLAFTLKKWSLHEGIPAGHKNLVVLRCQPPHHGRQSSWAGACVFSLPGLAFQSWGWNRPAPLPLIPLLQPQTSSSSAHLKAAERLLLQLLQAREEKNFLPGPTKPSWPSKTQLNRTTECLSSAASLILHAQIPAKKPEDPPSLAPHTPRPRS